MRLGGCVRLGGRVGVGVVSQVAGKAWDEAKAEAMKESGGAEGGGSWDWLAMLGVEPAKEGWRAVLEGEWARLEGALDEEWRAMLTIKNQQQQSQDSSSSSSISAQDAARLAGEQLEAGQRPVVPPPRALALAEGVAAKAAETVLGLLIFPLVLMGQVGEKAGLDATEAEADAMLAATAAGAAE